MRAVHAQSPLRTGLQILLLFEVLIITALALEPTARAHLDVWGADKINHIAAFCVLALTAQLAFPKLAMWKIIILGLGYGLAIELAQRFTGRTFSLFDVLADFIGLILGLILAIPLTYLLKTKMSNV